jgi:hypothetical protein
MFQTRASSSAIEIDALVVSTGGACFLFETLECPERRRTSRAFPLNPWKQKTWRGNNG